MLKQLQKLKRDGKINFIKIGTREFIGFDKKDTKFFIIFYNNKYREDGLNHNKAVKNLKLQLKELEVGIDDNGIYNTRDIYNKVKVQFDFINKYKS